MLRLSRDGPSYSALQRSQIKAFHQWSDDNERVDRNSMGRVFEKDSTTQRQPHKTLTSQSGVKGNSRYLFYDPFLGNFSVCDSFGYFSVCDSFCKFLKSFKYELWRRKTAGKQLEKNWPLKYYFNIIYIVLHDIVMYCIFLHST